MEFTVWQNYDTTKVQVLAVNVGESNLLARAFVRNFGLTYPVLLDSDLSVLEKYKLNSSTPFPIDCIIDQNGIIKYLHSEYEPQLILNIINDLVNTGNPGDDDSPTDSLANLSFNVYPSPANSEVNFEINYNSLSNGKIVISVYNILGQQLFKQNIERSQTGSQFVVKKNVNTFASGIYITRLEIDGRVFQRKFIILK